MGVLRCLLQLEAAAQGAGAAGVHRLAPAASKLHSPSHSPIRPPHPLPALQVWKDGQKVDELVGAAKDRLKALIEKHA